MIPVMAVSQERFRVYQNPEAKFIFIYPANWEIVYEERYETAAGFQADGHAWSGLNAQFYLKKSMLTAKLALVIRMDMNPI